MHKVTSLKLARRGAAGLFASTKALRFSNETTTFHHEGDYDGSIGTNYEDEEEILRLQQEMRASGGNGGLSSRFPVVQAPIGDDALPTTTGFVPRTATDRYFGKANGDASSAGSAVEKQRTKRRGFSGTSYKTAPSQEGGEQLQGAAGDDVNVGAVGAAFIHSSVALGDAESVAEAMRVLEDMFIGGSGDSGGATAASYATLVEEDEVLIAEERAASGTSMTSGNNKKAFEELPASQVVLAKGHFDDLDEVDRELLTRVVVDLTPSPSIKDTLKALDNCKSAIDVERVYKSYIVNIPLFSDILNGHGTRVVIIGKLTEVVARSFCVDQWLEVMAHARRYGFQMSRLHVNEVLTAIRIDASAMFQQKGRDPTIVRRTLDRLQLLIHFSKEDKIRWEGVFMARLCLICTVIVSFMDRQNYYRSSFPSDFHKRDGVVGDWVITHQRAVDYDETVRIVNIFLKEHGLDDHRQHLKIRPAFTTAYRLIDYYFSSDNLSQALATIEACMQQGVNVAESTIAKLMQLCVSFNHPQAIDLFRKYRLRMPEAVIATPDVSRLMSFYCRSGAGMPCPCCGEPYNHRNVQLSVWDATPWPQRRCPLLRMAREQRGEYEDLATNDKKLKLVFGGGGGGASLAISASNTVGGLQNGVASPDSDSPSEIELSIQEQLLHAEADGDGRDIEARLMNLRNKMIAGAGNDNPVNDTTLPLTTSTTMINPATGNPILSQTSLNIDIPQCRDWSHVAFSLFEFSKDHNILWSITEWRLFLQACTYLAEPEDIRMQCKRDVHRARAMKAKAMKIVPERRWEHIDPSSKTLADEAADEALFKGLSSLALASAAAKAKADAPASAEDAASEEKQRLNFATSADAEIRAHIASFENLKIKVSVAFAKKHGLYADGDGSSEYADLYSVADDEQTFIHVPWLSLSRAAKFDLANVIFKENINFTTQIDDFLQRIYLRFLRTNNPQEVNTRIQRWWEEGVGSGRGSRGGEIVPIVSEEIMIASFCISHENINVMSIVGGGKRPTGEYLRVTPSGAPAPSYISPYAHFMNKHNSQNETNGMAGILNGGKDSNPMPYSSLMAAQMRAEAATFAADRVKAQDLFVTAFAKRRSRRELFNAGFLIKVHRADVPRKLIDLFHQQARNQLHSQFASQAFAASSSSSTGDDSSSMHRNRSTTPTREEVKEALENIVLPPIDISKFSDDADKAEKDYYYVINPLALGEKLDPNSPSFSDFRFSSSRSVMSVRAKTAFTHLHMSSDESSISAENRVEEATANDAMLRKFVFLMRKKPRNLNARATFKDSGSDISPGFNKKNWYLVPKLS